MRMVVCFISETSEQVSINFFYCQEIEFLQKLSWQFNIASYQPETVPILHKTRIELARFLMREKMLRNIKYRASLLLKTLYFQQ